ncbi:ketose-bisphosphate aldolase [Sphingobacterium sp. Ka21]|uniref:Ketose-bisphosphate aldolase n=2 Tax=Sphingobacterium pedocola TaxID=2082722 RepID=A0ABR9TDC7_9SPHI|nr:ketose-bisphosphate aldolase [Sphingobacterium pedocola]
MTLKDKLSQLSTSNGCLLATNFYNFETLSGVLSAAAERDSSVILQLTQGSIEYMGLHTAVSMARSAMQEYGVEAWIHLDHAGSYELVVSCLDVGFDSVMIDYSERTFQENATVTRRVVELAEKYGANVEAELGYVAKLGQSKEKLGFTDPQEAQQFVNETGVHALAVAIGSAHGFYKAEPKLDLDLLREIKRMTQIPLVLHGGSGIPAATLMESIKLGICKINLATEIKDAFMRKLQEVLVENEEIDLRKTFPYAVSSIKDLVSAKLNVVNTGS